MRKFRFLKSFRLRIFMLLLLLGFCVAEIMRIGILGDLEKRRIEQRSTELGEQLRILSDRLSSADFFHDNSSEAINARISQLALVYGGRIMLADAGFRVIADSNGQSLGKYLSSEEVVKAAYGEAQDNAREGYLILAYPIMQYEEDGRQSLEGIIYARASTEAILRNETELKRRGRIIEIVLMLGVVAISAFVSYASARPFERLSRGMSAVMSLEQDIPVVSDYTETEEMVEAFHKLRGRLKLLDKSRSEFVSNVSHELKTPIASIKVLADSLNTQTDAPVEMYKEFMNDISTEVDRENAIITDLLELVRMDQGVSAMHVENADVNELLEQIVKRLGPLARKGEVDLILESRRAVSADIDAVKLGLALTNIIENGIKYNKRPGWVRVVLDADHQYLVISITDSGRGMAAEELEHIFEPFYRVDKSHSHEVSGTGLGLAISRRTLLLHRGSIEVSSTPGEGSSFTVRLPLVYIRKGGEKQ